MPVTSERRAASKPRVRIAIASEARTIIRLDPVTGQPRDDTFISTDAKTGRPVVEEIGVHGWVSPARSRFIEVNGRTSGSI